MKIWDHFLIVIGVWLLLTTEFDFDHYNSQKCMFRRIRAQKRLNTNFLTILMVKIKFWDHLLIVTIPLLLLRSGLIFSFWPLKIKFLAIWQYKGHKMAKYQILLLWKWWSISVCNAHKSINKDTVKLESHLYRIFWQICTICAGYTANFRSFLLISSVLVT